MAKLPDYGIHMRREIAEARSVFCKAASRKITRLPNLENYHSIYTLARGSSDAAATILAYEYMQQLGLPVASLPPSIFSLLGGISLKNAIALGISQSGASEDLVLSMQGARNRGAQTLAITNVANSAVEKAAEHCVTINAGEELAIPATKTVVGSIGAGLALLAALKPQFKPVLTRAIEGFAKADDLTDKRRIELRDALLNANNVYIIGRGSGYGAAQEIALKIKETCAIHAESYSASEVLHGPLQLVTRNLTVFILDTGEEAVRNSIDAAESRFISEGGSVWRVKIAGDVTASPAAASALLLVQFYQVVLETALAMGVNPDNPATLAKVTQTR